MVYQLVGAIKKIVCEITAIRCRPQCFVRMAWLCLAIRRENKLGWYFRSLQIPAFIVSFHENKMGPRTTYYTAHPVITWPFPMPCVFCCEVCGWSATWFPMPLPWKVNCFHEACGMATTNKSVALKHVLSSMLKLCHKGVFINRNRISMDRYSISYCLLCIV